MSLLAYWNRTYYSQEYRNYPHKRAWDMKRFMRQNLLCKHKGKGSKAWKRVKELTKEEFHLIGNIYIA